MIGTVIAGAEAEVLQFGARRVRLASWKNKGKCNYQGVESHFFKPFDDPN